MLTEKVIQIHFSLIWRIFEQAGIQLKAYYLDF